MSQKLTKFLVHFSDFSYNIIAYFYAEICTIYQIYILQKFKAEVKIPEKIRSENMIKGSAGRNRDSRSRSEVMARQTKTVAT